MYASVPVFDYATIAKLASTFIQSVPHIANQVINIDKLVLVHRLVRSEVFLHQQARIILLPTLMSHLEAGLKGNADEAAIAALSVTVLGHWVQTTLKVCRSLTAGLCGNPHGAQLAHSWHHGRAAHAARGCAVWGAFHRLLSHSAVGRT